MWRLIAEQPSDASLADSWQQAKMNKGDFVISKGVLYHKDKVEGQPICQLCVPEGKRVQIRAFNRKILINRLIEQVVD